MKITEKLKTQRLISDGGMGTMLQGVGLSSGDTPEAWNITHPEEIIAVHSEYIAAGANIITANTFGINRLKYSESEADEMLSAAFYCANEAKRRAARDDIYVALDIGSLGKLLKPLGNLDFEEAIEAFAFATKKAESLGADLILIETMNDSYETKAAVLAAKENSSLPIFVTNVYDAGGKLMTGADVGAMVALLEGLGVDAIGMNCSLGPAQMKTLLPEMIRLSSTPVMVQPNAGLPREEDGKTVFDVTPEEFASLMAEMAELGAAIVGGCCGTTPEYIKKIAKAVADIPYQPISQKSYTAVSSYTHACRIGDAPVLIGERINPTGKKLLKQALRDGDMTYILGEAVAEEERGVHILDVNVGLPEIDEKAMMLRVLREIQAVSALPLQIDTVDASAMEAAMRIYNGKPLVNSVNGKRESMEKIFPLVKKYGGVLIALTMDEDGIPDTAEGRFKIAEKIVSEAEKYGIDKRDIVADPLALAVSSDPSGAKTTLESIRLIKTRLGIATSLGISNISFGLPQRDIVTSSFYVMALEAGLDCAIMNPNSVEVMKAYKSWCALRGRDENFERYIAFASSVTTETVSASVSASTVCEGESRLQNAIIKGLRENAAAVCREMLEQKEPLSIIDSEIIPALNTVGKGFEEKRIYLPSLLMSAEAASAAFEEIKEKMPANESRNSKKIVLATVKGDIHDIGKNIVKVLLENFGFSVIDLGRDVPPEKVVGAAKEEGVRLVGLSALMTTTVPSMAETIRLLRDEYPEARVVVGGAVLTQEYADMIGADKYAADAMETVRYAQEIFD